MIRVGSRGKTVAYAPREQLTFQHDALQESYLDSDVLANGFTRLWGYLLTWRSDPLSSFELSCQVNPVNPIGEILTPCKSPRET